MIGRACPQAIARGRAFRSYSGTGPAHKASPGELRSQPSPKQLNVALAWLRFNPSRNSGASLKLINLLKLQAASQNKSGTVMVPLLL